MHDAMEWALQENHLTEVSAYFKRLDLDEADGFNDEVTQMLVNIDFIEKV